MCDLGQGQTAALQGAIGRNTYWNYDDDQEVCGDFEDFLDAWLVKTFHGAGSQAGGGGGEHENHGGQTDLLGQPKAAMDGGQFRRGEGYSAHAGKGGFPEPTDACETGSEGQGTTFSRVCLYLGVKGAGIFFVLHHFRENCCGRRGGRRRKRRLRGLLDLRLIHASNAKAFS